MINERKNVNLKNLNTFGINATCDEFIEFDTADDLREIFSRPGMADRPWYVLGAGSNIIFTGDYHGTLLHPTGRRIEVASGEGGAVHLRVEAGVPFEEFVGYCISHDLWGAENLTGIPGLVGSAPVQNIGAYGVELKDITASVEVFDVKSGATATLAREHCGFGYRDSVFKRELKGHVVITAVNFILGRTPCPILDYGDLRAKVDELGCPSLRNISDAVVAVRNGKLLDPGKTGNAGSFFKNPVVSDAAAAAIRDKYPDMPSYPSWRDGFTKLAAGWLIERTGWKGRSLGSTGVYEKQALVLVNLGGATGAEVLALAARIVRDVKERFGVELEVEVNVL